MNCIPIGQEGAWGESFRVKSGWGDAGPQDPKKSRVFENSALVSGYILDFGWFSEPRERRSGVCPQPITGTHGPV